MAGTVTITTASNRASAGNLVTGKVVGDGNETPVPIGFRPSWVLIAKDAVSDAFYFWIDSMGEATCASFVAAAGFTGGDVVTLMGDEVADTDLGFVLDGTYVDSGETAYFVAGR